MEEITIRAADGTALAATLWTPARARAAVIVAPALGVRRKFYEPLGAFLGEELVTLTIDYRDRTDATLHDYAALDLPTAIEHLRPLGLPITWLGHSMGGQLFGLLRDPPIARALFVAAQHGHWRNWRGLARYAMAALWWGVIPASVAIGRTTMPGGMALPPAVAREWARWGRDRRYLLRAATHPCAFDTWTGTLRALALAGDRYAPLSTVRPLVAAYARASTSVEIVEGSYGHFGAFRPAARALWADWRAWLGAGPSTPDRSS